MEGVIAGDIENEMNGLENDRNDSEKHVEEDSEISDWDDTKPKNFTLAEIVEDIKNGVHPEHPKCRFYTLCDA
jgi:hypothetical protein